MKDEYRPHHGLGQFSTDHRPLLDLLHRHSEPCPLVAERPKTDGTVAIDIKEDDAEVVVFADLPGVDEDDIHVDLESNILMISANREFDHDNEDSEEYCVLERAYGPIKRAINVPGHLDKNGMTARYRRGVLKVRIPKSPLKVIP